MTELFTGDFEFADYAEVEYGDGWFSPSEYEIKAWDGFKWVTEEETTDPVLKEIIRQYKRERPQ